jgi:hypothetical protein
MCTYRMLYTRMLHMCILCIYIYIIYMLYRLLPGASAAASSSTGISAGGKERGEVGRGHALGGGASNGRVCMTLTPDCMRHLMRRALGWEEPFAVSKEACNLPKEACNLPKETCNLPKETHKGGDMLHLCGVLLQHHRARLEICMLNVECCHSLCRVCRCVGVSFACVLR